MTEKTDFLMRSLSIGDTTMSVSRMRNSSGFASITIKVAGTEISFTTESYEGAYEQKAKQLAEMLDAIVSDPCLLPKDKP